MLELRWGGQVYRLTAGPLIVDSDAGPVQVLDGLTGLQWDDGMELLTTEAPEGSISLDVILPGVDVAARVEQGHHLGAATAELSRLIEGTPWEHRQVVMVGDVSEPMYGALDEPISFSVASVIYSDRTVIPDPASRVTAGSDGTWPDAPADAAGRVYPIVFGAPGVVDLARIAGSPAVVVDDFVTDVDENPLGMQLLIAGHATAALYVHVMHESVPSTWALAEVLRGTDSLEAEVSTVILSGLEGLAEDTQGYWVSWQGEDSAVSEGLHERRRERGIRTAGELLDYLLDLTALHVDQGRMDAAAAQLEVYRISGYIDERTNVWHWLRANLLPILPVSIRSGPDGLYPVVWRYTATADQAVEHLSADRLEVERAAPIRYTDAAKVANELVLDWALDARTRRYTERTVLSGRQGLGHVTSHLLRVSQARYGRRALDPLTTDLVYDSATASAILAWKAAYHALPARMLEYTGGPELLHLEAGDVVTLTDSEVHLSRQVAIVTEIRDAGDGRVGLVLRTIEDPSRVA